MSASTSCGHCRDSGAPRCRLYAADSLQLLDCFGDGNARIALARRFDQLAAPVVQLRQELLLLRRKFRRILGDAWFRPSLRHGAIALSETRQRQQGIFDGECRVCQLSPCGEYSIS